MSRDTPYLDRTLGFEFCSIAHAVRGTPGIGQLAGISTESRRLVSHQLKAEDSPTMIVAMVSH